MSLLHRAALALCLLLTPLAQANEEAAVSSVLDRFHAAASHARFDAYFGLFAPDGVFLGTDASERWTVAQFKAYAKPHFDKGQGWTYVMRERHINIAPDGSHAWFDELLDNASLGLCRGSGVLRKVDGDWKIAQYNLSIPMPNTLADELTKRIRGLQ
jgi:ketosteroid isomerase-like protein